MPFLKIQTNAKVSGEKREAIIRKASRAVAQELGKPEIYMMVSLGAEQSMIFAGNTEPVAFMELRAISLPAEKTTKLSALLCDLAAGELGIAKDRIYINFADVPANLWGWNGETF